jgi:hypothetical protein
MIKKSGYIPFNHFLTPYRQTVEQKGSRFFGKMEIIAEPIPVPSASWNGSLSSHGFVRLNLDYA